MESSVLDRVTSPRWAKSAPTCDDPRTMSTDCHNRVSSTAAPLLTILALLAIPSLHGCGDDDSTDPAGVGGSGGNASSSGIPSNSCESCTEDQECIQCNAVLPYKSCRTIVPVTAGTFQCSWLACSEGTEVCVDAYPLGDGCPDAACAPLPAPCADAATCECVQAELEVPDLPFFMPSGCTEDADGNFTVSGMN